MSLLTSANDKPALQAWGSWRNNKKTALVTLLAFQVKQRTNREVFVLLLCQLSFFIPNQIATSTHLQRELSLHLDGQSKIGTLTALLINGCYLCLSSLSQPPRNTQKACLH